jgi:hypothetical protein
MKKSIKVTFIFLLAVSLCLEPYDAYISGLCMIDLFLMQIYPGAVDPVTVW